MPQPAEAPFDTVVVLMMENRSFDHMLGWLPGANGRQQGLSYIDEAGVTTRRGRSPPTSRDVTTTTRTTPGRASRPSTPTAAATDFSRRARPDLPPTFTRSAITARTICRSSRRWQRLHDVRQLLLLDAGADVGEPAVSAHRNHAGRHGRDHRPLSRARMASARAPSDGDLRPRARGRPADSLLLSRRAHDRALQEQALRQHLAANRDSSTDARRGNLANVVFVDPDYTDAAEDAGRRTTITIAGNVLVAEGFVAQVYNALKNSPQWDRMVFVLNFDEHGGFFDHVPPPACQDDTVQTGPGPFPDLKRLGFRVPAIAMGPFAPRKIETGGSLRALLDPAMIEWRWGLAPMTLRDRTARNFADALDFTIRAAPSTCRPSCRRRTSPAEPGSRRTTYFVSRSARCRSDEGIASRSCLATFMLTASSNP